MKYTPYPLTQRIKSVKEEYMKGPVAATVYPYGNKRYFKFCTGDRWITLGFLEGWLKYEKAPTTFRRRAYAEAEELYAAKPVITEHELITGQPYLPEYSDEEYKRYCNLYEMFHMSSVTCYETGPRIDHLSLDFDKLLRVGLEGLISELTQRKAAVDLNDRNVYPNFDTIERYDFYESCLIELEALSNLQQRYATEARRLSEAAIGSRKKELERMADALDRVPFKPAQSFYEALQSIELFVGTLFGLYPLNRPDRYLYPYYEKDIREGRITPAEAQELIDNYCLIVSTRVFSRAACGFIVGGEDADGNLIENELTYMFLTALEHIRMPDPNGALAVSDKTSDDILRYSVEILSKGVTHPAFYNDTAIVNSLIKYGCPRSDAVNYIHTTCAEISVIGKSRSHTTPYCIPLPEILRDTMRACDDGSTYDDILNCFTRSLFERLQNRSLVYLTRMLEAKRNAKEPVRVCCLVDDCLERGKSIWDGGERYSFLQPILIGFATTVDSLIAIKKLIFEEKRLKLTEFRSIVESDYIDAEALRQYIINRLPHYGNDNSEADETAACLSKKILKLFTDSPLLAGHMMMPGTFSYINHSEYGSRDIASYDGRHAGTSYSDGCSPVQGRDTSGPTAMILSLTGWDQSAFLGGMVVNVKFTPEHLTEKYADSFIDLLRAFIKRGGLELQVNAVNKATLLDAQKNPSAHRNLIVRIGGYSDYYVKLSKTLQNEIIERSEY